MGGSSCQPADLKSSSPIKQRDFIRHRMHQFADYMIPVMINLETRFWSISNNFPRAIQETKRTVGQFTKKDKLKKWKFRAIQLSCEHYFSNRLQKIATVSHGSPWEIHWDMSREVHKTIQDLEKIRKCDDFQIIINEYGEKQVDLRFLVRGDRK